MLSQIELEYLRSPQSFNANYRRVLHHRIRAKVRDLSQEMPLLADIIRECNGVTEFSNGGLGLNQAALEESWCGRRDLDPGRRRGRPMS